MELLTIDPDIRDLLPAVYGTELDLEIGPEGPREPLVAWPQGEEEPAVLLDGHRRYEICQRRKLPYKVIYKEFPDKEAACKWMIGNQTIRRNWTAHERAETICRLAGLIAEKNRERGSLCPVEEANKETAALFGVTERSIYRGKQHAKAMTHIAPDIKEAIEKRSLAASARDIVELAGHDHEEQRDIVSSLATGEFNTIKDALLGKGAEYEEPEAVKQRRPTKDAFDAAVHHMGQLKKYIDHCGDLKPGPDYPLLLELLKKPSRRLEQWRDS